ncbi:hypothetical protein QBC45DRAFT_340779, partial [Copromyces sp. CBS 386.78]
PVVRTTPTSITTNNIEGSTLYSFFKFLFGITSLFNLEARQLTYLQNRFKGYNYFIIDKKFILSIRTIYFINNRFY